MTDCPYGNDKCPVASGPPMKHGMDCQYCKTKLTKAEVAALPPEKREWLEIHRKNVPMRGGA
jgi:hypothetical protein